MSLEQDLIDIEHDWLDHMHQFTARKAWSEADHPRHPAGDERGGEFAEKGGAAKLTDDEREAVAAYIGAAYGPLNDYLRTGNRDPNEIYDGIFTPVEFVPHLDRAISKSIVSDPITVYRDVGDYFNKLSGFASGTVIQDKGYVSTTENYSILDTRKNIVSIRVPAGSRGLRPRGFGNDYESEMILPRGSKFRVIDKRTLELIQ